LAKTFGVLKNHGIVVDLVSTSEISISFSIENGNISPAMTDLKKLGDVKVETNLAILAVVGQNIKSSAHTASTLFSVLSSQNIETAMISKGASRVNISCVIPETKIEQALPEVHKAFFKN
jgi:aspartate kinase